MARPGVWIDTLVSMTLTATVQQNQDMMGIASFSESRRGWTLVRTIVGLDVAYAVHDSGEGSHLVSMGIALASTEALSGTASITEPDVVTEHPAGGYLYRAQYRIYGFAADDPAVYNMRVEKDLRGSRKLNNALCVFSAVSTLEEGVASATAVTGIIRQYWLAP